MIDKAKIFESILERNALRREAGLPPWPVRGTYEREVRAAFWRAYLIGNGSRVRAEVLAKQQAEHGLEWPTCGSSRFAYACLVATTLRQEFRERYAT